MIRRHKTTIFTDAKESTTVYELKRIVEGILKRPPEEQILYKVRLDLSGPGWTAGSQYRSYLSVEAPSLLKCHEVELTAEILFEVFNSIHGFKKSIFFSDRL